jgi:hypothetical protein
MKKLALLIIPCLLIGAIAVACGGGGSKTVKIGDSNVSVSGKMPSGFPSDFPVYKGASVQGSINSSQGGIKGTAVTWTTGDSVDKVTAYYDQQFKDGPWKSSANGTAGGGSYWMADSPDGKQAGYVMVTSSSGKTSIVATVGDNPKSSSGGNDTPSSGSSSKSTPSSDQSSGGDTPEATTSSSSPLPDEVKLSSDFPKDRVPLPSGARITNDVSFSGGGTTTNSVEIYVKDKPENVSEYFKAEAPKHDWKDAFSSTSNGQYFLTFSGATNEALTISIEQSDTPGYAKATIAVVLTK